MIRHIVVVRLRRDLPEGERDAVMATLDALRAVVPGMLSFTPIANVSPEEPVTHGFLDGFVVDFADAAARDVYLDHPAHKAAGARLVSACENGLAGLLVFDHEL